MFFSDSMQRKQSTVVSPNPPNAASLALEGQILKLIMWKIPATALMRFRCWELWDWLKEAVSFVNVRDSCSAEEGDECCLGCFAVVASFYFQDTHLQAPVSVLSNRLHLPAAAVSQSTLCFIPQRFTLGWNQNAERKESACCPFIHFRPFCSFFSGTCWQVWAFFSWGSSSAGSLTTLLRWNHLLLRPTAPTCWRSCWKESRPTR